MTCPEKDSGAPRKNCVRKGLKGGFGMGILDRIFGNRNRELCPVCGKTLARDDRYYIDGVRCCIDCYRKKHPESFCARCGREAVLYVLNGRKYCNSCYEIEKKQRTCQVCGEVFVSEKERNSIVLAPGREVICCAACLQKIREWNITSVERLPYLASIRSSQRPKSAQETTGHGVLTDAEMREERGKKSDGAVLKDGGGQKYSDYGEQESGRREEQQPGNIRDMLPGLEKLVIDETPHGRQLKERILAYKAAWHRHDGDRTPENHAALMETMHLMMQTLENTPLLLPVALKEGGPDARFGTLHCSTDGAAMLSTVEAVRLIREDRIEELQKVVLFIQEEQNKAKRLTFVKQQGERMVPDPSLWDMGRFDGCDGWSFGSPLDDLGPWRGMMVEAVGSSYIALYTDIRSMRQLHSEDAWPCTVVVSAAEAKHIIRTTPECAGMIINPNSETHCMLQRQAFFQE